MIIAHTERKIIKWQAPVCWDFVEKINGTDGETRAACALFCQVRVLPLPPYPDRGWRPACCVSSLSRTKPSHSDNFGHFFTSEPAEETKKNKIHKTHTRIRADVKSSGRIRARVGWAKKRLRLVNNLTLTEITAAGRANDASLPTKWFSVSLPIFALSLFAFIYISFVLFFIWITATS